MISSFPASLPFSGQRKRRSECSDSIRSKGFREDHEFNVRWLRAARRVLEPDGTLWVTGTHHIIFSIGFALQRLGFRIINQIAWQKPDPVPNALHTAFTQMKAVATSTAGSSRMSPEQRRVVRARSCSTGASWQVKRSIGCPKTQLAASLCSGQSALRSEPESGTSSSAQW
jgi:hypothetical protein